MRKAHVKAKLNDVVAHQAAIALAQLRQGKRRVDRGVLRQPHHKLVAAHSHDQRAPGIALVKAIGQHLGKLPQDHVTKDQAIGGRQARKAQKVNKHQDARRTLRAHVVQHLKPARLSIQTRNRINGAPKLALARGAFLLGNVAQVSNEHARTGFLVSRDFTAHRVPDAVAALGVGIELHGHRIALKRQDTTDLLDVGVRITGAAHLGHEVVVAPGAVKATAVDHLDHIVLLTVSDKDVLRALDRHAVAFLLFAKLGGGAQLALGKVGDNSMQLVDLADARRFEGTQALDALLHAVNQAIDRSCDMTHDQGRDRKAKGNADRQRVKKARVKRAAQAIDRIARDKAANNPVFILKRNVVAVEGKRRRDAKNLLRGSVLAHDLL